MSDDFIPLNQSTPRQNKWQRRSFTPYQYRTPNSQPWQNNRQHNRRNNSNRNNSSFGSDWSKNSPRPTETDINAYLHPSMTQDPWAQLRARNT